VRIHETEHGGEPPVAASAQSPTGVDSVPLAADELRLLATPLTPTASVYLGLQPSVVDGDTRLDLDLRRHALVARLAVRGADEATIEALAAFLADVPVSPSELVVFARDGVVIAAQEIPGGAGLDPGRVAARFDRARFAVPPDLLPLLAWQQRHPAHVVAVTDRAGADITATRRGRLTGTRTAVAGPDDEIERNAPGGWSQPRYQRRAEDSWRHNATAVAGAVLQALRDVHSGLLLLAGDVRAVQLLRQRLPRTVQIRHLPGGRSEDGSAPARRTAIAAALDAYAAERSARLIDRLVADRGPPLLLVVADREPVLAQHDPLFDE
jgi:hypothetical protein